MKKSLIFVFIFLILVNLTLIKSQSEAPGIDEAPLVGTIQNITQDGNIDQIKSDYLKQEWGKTFSNSPVLGPIFRLFNGFFTTLNPFFMAVLGVEYSLSWAFVFAIMLWLALFFFLYKPATAIFNKSIFGIIAAFVIASLVGLSGVLRIFVNLMVTAVTNIWIAVLCFFISLFLVILLEKFGGALKKKIMLAKEKSAKEKTDKDRTIIHTEAEIAKNQLDEYGTSVRE